MCIHVALYTQCFPSVCEKNFTGDSGGTRAGLGREFIVIHVDCFFTLGSPKGCVAQSSNFTIRIFIKNTQNYSYIDKKYFICIKNTQLCRANLQKSKYYKKARGKKKEFKNFTKLFKEFCFHSYMYRYMLYICTLHITKDCALTRSVQNNFCSSSVYITKRLP